MVKNYLKNSIFSFLVICGIFFVNNTHSQSFSLNNLNFNGHGSISAGTSLMFGPDGRLYVTEYSGTIKILTIQRDGPGIYKVIGMETLTGIQGIQDHNDDGTIFSNSKRETTGFTVTGTATNPIIYVASSDFRIGGGGGGSGDLGLDTNSGVITRFIWKDTSWDVVDIVRGLPRSEENHATNGIEYVNVKDNDYLIVAQGGHTNAGSPSANFAYTSEYALSAAILSVNLTLLEGMSLKNDNGRTYIYDIPTLDDPTRPNLNGITDPDSSGYTGMDINDPFGGNDGLNQAIIVPGGPIQIFSPGFRNAYDLVVTSNGAVYVTDNGANGGWGGFPENEGGGFATNKYLSNEPGSTTSTGNEQINNLDHLSLVTTNIQNYSFGSFYGGHPNPTRANPSGSGLYTNPSVTGTNGAFFRTQVYDPNGSRPNSTTNPNTGLPANWPPVPLIQANTVEGDWRGPGLPNPDGPIDAIIATWGTNTNGIDEYTASNFNNAMKGNLIVGVNTGVLRRVELKPDGSLQALNLSFVSGIGGDALGVTCNSDTDLFPGTIWVVTLNGKLIILEPQDFANCLQPGDVGYDASADYDLDGYSNQDEIDNGTDHCNGGSQPNDFDKSAGGALLSDINDMDDDNDGISDADDPFQLGNPASGGSDAFALPVTNELFSSTALGGYMGLGLTGMMNNGNQINNWLGWLDRRNDPNDPNPNDILGGAIGAMTMQMTAGTALGTTNSQEKGFQYGIQVDQNTGIFTVMGGLTNFNAPLQLYGNSSAPNGELGFFIGDGTQANYIRFVLTKSGFTIQQEIDNVPQQAIDIPISAANRPNAGTTFYFEVNPVNGAINFDYAFDAGPRISIGNLIAKGTILTAIQKSNVDLAVGLIGSSNENGVEVEGTWDFLNVIQENPTEFTLRLNTGGPAITHSGLDFMADGNFVGGQAYTNLKAQVPAMYQTERSSPTQTFQYNVPLANGYYEVVLHFAEIYWGATGGGNGGNGKRIFDVNIEGALVLDNFDIYAEVGPEVVVIKNFTTLINDGLLNIDFSAASNTGGVNQPKVSAIEVFKVQSNTPPVAVLSASHDTGDAPLEVSFFGSGSTYDNQITDYFWEFGDGGTSMVADPTYTYNSPGIFPVTLTVSDVDGLNATETHTITVKNPNSEGFDLRINAGGQTLLYNGESFISDQYFNGGKVFANSNAIVSSLYQTERSASPPTFSYDIPVPNGNYKVKLHFAEIYFGAQDGGTGGIGKRVFDVTGEGVLLLDDYDIYADVGAETPVIKTYVINVEDEVLNLTFEALEADGVNQPKVSAIEVISTGQYPPIVINPIQNQSNAIGDDISTLSVSVSGGDPNANFVYSLAGEPSGIFIEPTNGLIYGNIDSAALFGGNNNDGIHSVTITVTKPGSAAVSIGFNWTIGLSWTNKANIGTYTARHECSFVQAGDKFYLMGGRENAKTLDVYDYASNNWTSLSNSAPKDFNHFQATEYQGLIWVIGAFRTNAYPNELSADYIWAFDPAAQVWIQGAAIPVGRKRGSAGLVVYNDKFYLVAGNTKGHDGPSVPWLDEYDPSTNTWTTLTNAPRARDHFHAVVIGDKLYAAGGRLTDYPDNVFNQTIPEVDVYDFTNNSWSTIGKNLPTQRAGAAAVNLNNKLIVIGGEVGNNTSALKVTEQYDPSTGIWSQLPDLNNQRHGTQAIVSGGSVFITAGSPTRGGGNQGNMEYMGSSSATGTPSLMSTLTIPTTVKIDENATANINIEISGGNVGVIVRSIQVLGTNASDFSIISGNLTNSLLKANSQHTLTITNNGNTPGATAQLILNHGADTQSIIQLEGGSGGGQTGVVSLTLVNADTDTDLFDLTEGQQIDQSNTQGIGLNIRANTNPATVGSVSLSISGPVNNTRVENVAVYALFGNNGSNYTSVPLPLGDYVVSATAYSGAGQTGNILGSLTYNFSIVNQTNSCWENLTDSGVSRLEAPSAKIDNKLYVFGGFLAGLKITGTTEIYDLTTDSWSLGTPMPMPATHMGIVPIDNEIWILAGFLGDHPGAATEKVQIYNSITDNWSFGPDLPNPRGSGTATLNGRKIHFFGGLLPDRINDVGEHYILDLDNLNNGWTAAAPLPNPRNHLSSATINGIIYAIGGQYGHDNEVADQKFLHAYDPKVDAWTRLADLPSARSHFEPGTTTHNGNIIIVGGRQGDFFFDDVTQYDPRTNQWKELCKLPEPLLAPAAKVFNDKLIVSNGGVNGTCCPSTTTRWLQLEDAINQPPSAAISASQLSGDAPLIVNFLGNNSTDDKFDKSGVLNFSWNFSDGAASTEVNPTHTFTDPGVYPVELVVTDGGGLTDVLTLSITVNTPLVNQPPMAVARTVGPISGFAPFSINFIGSDSNDPEDGTGLSYAWDFGDNVGTSTMADPPSYTYNTAGTYNAILTVMDSGGLQDTDIITIQVNENNQNGVTSLTLVDAGQDLDMFNLSNNQQITQTTIQGKTLSIRANTNPSIVGSVQLSLSGMVNKVSTENVAPYALFGDSGRNYSGVLFPLGNYTITATAYSGSNLSGNNLGSLTMQFTIAEQGSSNQPPIAVASGIPISGNAPLTVNFTGSNSSDGEGPVTYSWNFGDGTPFSSVANPSHTYTNANNFTAILTVTDVEGLQDTANVSIQVNEPIVNGVTSFTLVDAGQDLDIFNISNNQQINQATTQGKSLNIRANTNPVTVGSVRLVLSGTLNNARTENVAPYALFGDSGGNYSGVLFPLGTYTITATAYSGSNLSGTVLGSLSQTFSIVSTAKGNTVATTTALDSGNSNNIHTLRHYPNPAALYTEIAISDPLIVIKDIYIRDIGGRLVVQYAAEEMKIGEGIYGFSVAGLEDGIYLVSLMNGSTVVMNYKLLVKK